MLLEALLGIRASRRSESINPGDQRLATLWGSPKTKSGATVNENTALNIPVVLGGFSLVSNKIKSMPWFAYERVSDGRELLTGHNTYRLLHQRPNPTLSPSRFKKMMIWWALSWGNGRAEIERNGLGEGVNLWPIHPSRCYTKRELDGHIVHEVYNDNGTVTTLDDANVLHTYGFSKDGVTGISVVGLIREALGIAVTAEEYSARFYQNNAQPSVVLEHPKTLSDSAQVRIKTNWIKAFADNERFGTFVAEEDMKVRVLGVPQKDAQFVESRTFDIQQFCRVLNIPPHKLAEMSHSTFSNIEHQAIEAVGDAYMPWAIDLEEEADRKLFTDEERDVGYYTEFLVDGLLRGDSKTRNEAFKIQREQGIISANEWRRRENMNRQPGEQGDVYLVPMNMAPATEYTEDNYEAKQQQPALPAPPPQEPDGDGDEDEDEDSVAERERIAAACTPLLAHAIERMLGVEANARNRAGTKPDAVEAWKKEFYAGHALAFRRAIIPGMDAMASLVRGTLSYAILATDWERFTAQQTADATDVHIDCAKSSWSATLAGNYASNQAASEAIGMVTRFINEATEPNRWDVSKN